MLAVAGLPYAYTSIISHEGCTYLRRASHEEIGLFTWEETDIAMKEVFSEIKGFEIEDRFVDKINRVSYGHPYLMQLLGYHLIVQINANDPGKNHVVTEKELDAAIVNALLTYEHRALKPLLEERTDSENKYLKAMSEQLGDDRLAFTSDIAKSLGVTSNKLSKTRAHLIDNGIIAAPEHGKVMFCIPYLADYVKKENRMSSAVDIARERRV